MKLWTTAFDKAGEKEKQTRSVLVIYEDQIIAEKYLEGFDHRSVNARMVND